MVSPELWSIPTMIIRGGTSKGVYLMEDDLPADRSLWDPFLIALFGASDLRQIDGVGGAMPTTSKCCIVARSQRDDADVDYTFAQIGIGENRVYWDFNCGNLTPSVGTYAILTGLVVATPGETTVRVYQTNTKMLLQIHVPTTTEGMPTMDGDLEIAGVTGSGPAVLTDFSRAVGASLGGGLFPTGNRIDAIAVQGRGEIECSIVDLANMCVFFRAADAGLTGFETLAQGPEIVPTFVAVREAAQQLLGVDPSKTTPWPVAIAAPAEFTSPDGGTVAADSYDFSVRFAGIQPMRDTLHEAYPGTASCCTAVAAVARGTVVSEIYGSRPHSDDVVAMAHPSGVMIVNAAVMETDRACHVTSVTVARTVRPILAGQAFVRGSDVARLSGRSVTELGADVGAGSLQTAAGQV
jgi:hypothetical protein